MSDLNISKTGFKIDIISQDHNPLIMKWLLTSIILCLTPILRPPDKSAYWKKLFFLFVNQNICCGYSKYPSQWDGSFENPKHLFKLMGKEINAIKGAQTILIWTYVSCRGSMVTYLDLL